MGLFKLGAFLLLIIASADAQWISCGTTCVPDNTPDDGGSIIYKCQLKNFGSGRPTLTWYNKWTGKELEGIPNQTQRGSTISRDFSEIAVAPPAQTPLVCFAKISSREDTQCEIEPTGENGRLCEYSDHYIHWCHRRGRSHCRSSGASHRRGPSSKILLRCFPTVTLVKRRDPQWERGSSCSHLRLEFNPCNVQ